MTIPIQVWRFDDSPEEFRKLWTEGHGFGRRVERHELPDGRVVLIGSHG